MLKNILKISFIIIGLFLFLILVIQIFLPKKDITQTWYKDENGYIHYKDMIIPEEEFNQYNINK